MKWCMHVARMHVALYSAVRSCWYLLILDGDFWNIRAHVGKLYLLSSGRYNCSCTSACMVHVCWCAQVHGVLRIMLSVRDKVTKKFSE